MPTLPVRDMAHYNNFLNALPEDRITAEEAAALKADNDIDGLFAAAAKLVPYIVQKFVNDAHRQECYADLVQAGNMGVLTAAESWVPGPGRMAWTSWAFMYIRKAVIREMQRQLRFNTNYVLTDFSRDYTDEAKDQSDLYLDDTPIADVLNDGDQWEAQNEARLEVEDIRSQLDARERVHLDLLQEGVTQQEIATRLGVSQSRVSRLTTKLFAKCRDISEA